MHRADEVAVGQRSEKQPAAVLDLHGNRFECAARLLVREGRQIADGRASLDAIDENGRQLIELRANLGDAKTPDLDLLNREHRRSLHDTVYLASHAGDRGGKCRGPQFRKVS